MTDKEKAIVMAYTGVCMLTGDKFVIFHRYVEDIMGRSLLTHELAFLRKEIMEKATPDFLALCSKEDSSEKRYTRLFDALKFNWMITCEHDDKLTDKIERCEKALTTLKNLGFNLVTGEVENEKSCD